MEVEEVRIYFFSKEGKLERTPKKIKNHHYFRLFKMWSQHFKRNGEIKRKTNKFIRRTDVS
jgi:hypothetical protein